MKSIQDLNEIRQNVKGSLNLTAEDKGTRIVVGLATCGMAAGAGSVLTALKEEVEKRRLKDVTVTQTGCIGICHLEPVVEIYQSGVRTTYIAMDAKKAIEVLDEHIEGNQVVEKYTIGANE